VIVLDASVVLAAEDLDDPYHTAAVAVLEGVESLATVELCAWEVTNVAVRAWGDREAASRLARRVWLIERSGELLRADAELVASAASLAAEHDLSAYDAAYVAAAGRLAAPLVSCDLRDLVRRGLATPPRVHSSSA
jgi:predicted nucleic acid-binding protein